MRRRYNPKLWWIVLGLIVVLVIISLISFSSLQDEDADGFGGSSISPVMSFFSKVTIAVRDFFLRLFSVRDIDEEYRLLELKVAELEVETVWASEQQKEIERLTKLLGYTETFPEYKFLHASVIGRDINSWYSYFTIDKGTNHGVTINMAIVTDEGLAGKVIECGYNFAKVITVIDTEYAVASVVERSRDNGVLRGAVDPSAAEPICSLLYIPFDADLIPGDRILSSNLGGIYPKGIPIGEVIEVAQNEAEKINAYVLPFVDFSRIENVLVIIGETELDIYKPIVEDITDDIVNLPDSDMIDEGSTP